jgi:ATP-binding cassette subfamily G (WHITE) protein 2 (SNQ2)
VTDPNGRILRSGVQPPPPATALEFAAHFRRSPIGRVNADDIAAYRNSFTDKPGLADAYRASARAERSKHARRASPYTVSIFDQASAVMLRRVQIIKGNLAGTLVQLLYVGFHGYTV